MKAEAIQADRQDTSSAKKVNAPVQRGKWVAHTTHRDRASTARIWVH